MTDPTKIDVVALVVSPDTLTFYKTDGSVYSITQGDPRGGAMSDEFFAQRKLGKEVVTLLLEEEKKTGNHLNSEKRNPLIRFFRAPLDAIRKLFSNDSISPNELTDDPDAAERRVKELAARLMKSDRVVAESTDDLPLKMVHSEEPMGENETIIGVTEDGIIPHIESLNDQFKAGDEGKASSTGPDNLIIRLTKMSAKRGHTASELLKFLENIDLPVLPDGSFLAYKRLIHQGYGVYVDPHTKRVHQRIGDTVQMDESLVDTNRRQECSQGLHVGTRQYMGGFHGKAEGSGTMLVLIQPEDAIAVPLNETSKMRASRYLILADLSNKAHDLVNQNKRMDACKDTMEIVAQIVAGARPPLLGIVNIGAASGNGLEYRLNGQTPATNITLEEARNIAGTKATAPKAAVTPVRTIDETTNGNMTSLKPEKVRDKSYAVKPVDAKAKAQASTPAAKPAKAPKSARETEAQRLCNLINNGDRSHNDRREAAIQLKKFKKTAKVSWNALGLPGDMGDTITKLLDKPVQAESKPSKPAPKQPDSKAKAKADRKPEPVKTAPQPKKATQVKASAPSGGTRQDRARDMWLRMSDPVPFKRKAAAQELRTFKSKAKVSWDALGLGKYNVEAELKKLLD